MTAGPPWCRPSAQQTERRRNWGGQAGKSADSSWMYRGDGAYVPDPNAAPDMRLRLWETVQVLDVGLVRHPASALLDSGARTLAQKDFSQSVSKLHIFQWPGLIRCCREFLSSATCTRMDHHSGKEVSQYAQR